MATLATDSGAGADANPIGGNWTTVAGLSAMRRVSNQIANSGSDADSGAYYNAVTPPNDQWAECTLAATGTYSSPAICVSTSAQSMYWLGYVGYASQWGILSWVSGSFNELGLSTGTNTPNAGDVLYLEKQGTTLVAKVNGVTKITLTDSALTGGRGGVHQYEASARITNWSVGDFVAGGSSPKRALLLGVG